MQIGKRLRPEALATVRAGDVEVPHSTLVEIADRLVVSQLHVLATALGRQPEIEGFVLFERRGRFGSVPVVTLFGEQQAFRTADLAAQAQGHGTPTAWCWAGRYAIEEALEALDSIPARADQPDYRGAARKLALHSGQNAALVEAYLTQLAKEQ